jgi:hypothetical protein
VFGEVHAVFLKTRGTNSANSYRPTDWWSHTLVSVKCVIRNTPPPPVWKVLTNYSIEVFRVIRRFQFMYGWNSERENFKFVPYSFLSSAHGYIGFLRQPSHEFKRAAKNSL